MSKNLIVILGPTAVGKSNLAARVAGLLGCGIISSDSRQFYREMRIGTAVPSQEELKAIKHHFIHNLTIEEYYSSSIFEKEVLSHLGGWFAHHDNAVMAGGSGMYIDAVCDGTDDIPDVDPTIRDHYLEKYRLEGIESLRVELKHVDPAHYSKIDLRNPQRLLRALEITASSGKPYSSFLTSSKRERAFNTIKIGLNLPREKLYEQINRRVDRMVESGLEDEARSLLPFRRFNATNTVGYREFFDYFDGLITYEEAIRLIKRNSRHYAKRQLTWWMKDESINWFSPDDEGKIFEFIKEKLALITPDP